MSKEDLIVFYTMVIDLCDQAFPQEWDHETCSLCRKYFGQVIGPLLNLQSESTWKLADILVRVGTFLRRDGKFTDSANLLIQSLKMAAQTTP